MNEKSMDINQIQDNRHILQHISEYTLAKPAAS